MPTHSQQEKIFYYFLSGIFILHALFMVVQVKTNQTIFQENSQAIKIQLVQDPLKDRSANIKQIVRSEDAASNQQKKDAFLSDKDRSFDRQSVAKTVKSFKKAAKGNSTVTQQAQKKTARKRPSTSLKDLKLSDVGVMSGGPMPEKASRAPASLSKKGLENGDELSQGFSATNDFIDEMTLGDFTHLNTVEYKFYGFFHRIRQKLEQFWGNSIQEKSEALFRSGRRMPASENLVTSLEVTLNKRGEIVAVKVLGASGVKELDDAAVESFNQAGPFPNPPKELLVNGKVTIHWGFVVKS